MGRPSSFTQEKADAICERLIEGESLRSICRDDDMPHPVTVFRWLDANESFRNQYARARSSQAERMAEEILQIADTPVDGERIEESDDGMKVVREDMLGHRRLQVDTRKWLMSKLAPKKYGDKVEVENTGTMTVVNKIERTVVRPNPTNSDG